MQIKNIFKKNPANKFQNHFHNFRFFAKIVRRFLKDYMINDLSWSYVSGKFDHVNFDESSWHISDDIAESLYYDEDDSSSINSESYPSDTGSDYEWSYEYDD
jgi:hypothetical protein